MASADNAGDSRGKLTALDHQESLALVTEQVSHAQRVNRQTPIASSEDEGDSIFLCGFASQDSFVGCLEDEESMTDEAIEDFVRQNNPEMFVRLFESEDTAAKIREGNGIANKTSTAVPGYDIVNASYDFAAYGGTAMQVDLQQILLQLKQILVSSLLNGHILILQKLAVNLMLCCAHPYCRFNHDPIPRGSFVLELRFENTQQANHFCLRCVEGVFIRQFRAGRERTAVFTTPSVSLDGMTADVIEAAQRLAAPKATNRSVSTPSPKRVKAFPMQKGSLRIQDYFTLDFAFNHPSNSTQALVLRRRKDTEIEEILIHVEKYEKRRFDDFAAPQKSHLVITQPLQMPGEERYKKQGLGEWDKKKERTTGGKRDRKSDGSNTTTSLTKSLKTRICHCGEPAGVGQVVKCGAEFCPVGAYHLECTGLREKSREGMVWLCSNCSNAPEGTPVAAAASESEEEMQVDECDCESDDEMEEGYLSDKSFCDGDQMSIADREVESSSEPTTPPSVDAAVEIFTPVNRQQNSGSPSTPMRTIDASTNSFTPVNPGHTPGTITPFTIRCLPAFSLDGPPTIDGMAQLCLPVGWSEATFEDLAPFIIAETNVTSLRALTLEHMGMLEEWKALCPTSRLLPGQRRDFAAQGNSAQDSPVVPLSYLLDRVEAQMTRY